MRLEPPLICLDDRDFPIILFNAIFYLAALLADWAARKQIPIVGWAASIFNVRNFLYVINWLSK